MPEQEHDKRGRFAAKGKAIRVVRTIRVTDATWEAFGEKAYDQDMTRADYLEALLSDEVDWERDDADLTSPGMDFDPDEVVEILREALTLKANAGGKIKARIREAIQLMGYDSSEDE